VQKRPMFLGSLLIVAILHLFSEKRMTLHTESSLLYSLSSPYSYAVAMIRRLLKIIGLFCKRALSKRRYSAKETYDFREPTNRSHPTLFSEQKKRHCTERALYCVRENNALATRLSINGVLIL